MATIWYGNTWVDQNEWLGLYRPQNDSTVILGPKNAKYRLKTGGYALNH